MAEDQENLRDRVLRPSSLFGPMAGAASWISYLAGVYWSQVFGYFFPAA
jgi:hypothetical protein